MRKCTPWLCKSFVRLTVKFCCSPVGTVAVAGVRVTEMPESRTNTEGRVFLVAWTDVAVMVTRRLGNFVGSGTLLGAVKVTVVLAEFVGMFPVSDVQGSAAAVVGLPVESTVVVVKVQAQVTFRLVALLTIEVSVID